MSHYGDERLAVDGFEHFQIDLAEILEVEASDARCVLPEPIQLLGVDADPVGKIDRGRCLLWRTAVRGSTWANVRDGAPCYPAGTKTPRNSYRPRRSRLWRSWGRTS